MVGNYKVKTNKSTKAKHKILIIGYNYAWGIFFEIQYNLEEDFQNQGIMKHGSDLGSIMNTVTKHTGVIAKLDVVWGDTNDVSKTNSKRP